MTQILNVILTLGVPAIGLLIAYRVWAYATKSSGKSPMQVVSSLISILLVFAAGVLFIPRALNWGSNVFVSQMMANPGIQAGFSLAGTGAGLLDSGLSGVLSQGAQAQAPQVAAPQIDLSGLFGASTQDAPQSSLSLPFAEWSQSNGLAGSQVTAPQVTIPTFDVPSVATGASQGAPAAPAQNLVQQVQAQAQATAQAIVSQVQQAQTDAQAIKEFSFDTFLATPEVSADCLTGATQGPQLPHCVGIDRQAAANNVWHQQQADIADYAKETTAQLLESFSWADTENAQATAEANIARAAANATAQAVNVANQQAANQQAAADAEYQAWVNAQAEAQRVEHEKYLQTLTLSQPTATPQAPVYQAADPAIPADCLTGSQQGPQLPHCMGVDRSIHGQDGGSVWAMAGK